MCLALAGCGQQPSSSDGVTYFHPLQAEESLVEPVEDPGAPVDTEEMRGYRQIMEGFRANAGALFQRSDIEKRLDQIEQVFISTGHYLELVGIYQRVVEQQGIESKAAPRLAWSLVRLGQRQQAKTLIDRLKDARPQDPDVHFIDGAFWLNRAQDSREAAAKTAMAWQKTLELDSDYKGFQEATASDIQNQIDRLKQNLGAAPSEIIQKTQPPAPVPAAEPPSEDPRAEDQRDTEGTSTPDAEARERPSEPDAEETAQAAASSDPTDSPEETESDSPDATGAPQESPTTDEPSTVKVRLMRASLAASKGDLETAKRQYESVLEDESNNLQARFGLLKVRQKQGDAIGTLEDEVRSLLDHPELDAPTAYNIGLFVRARLDSDELATSFFDVVRTKDPEFAEQNGLK